MSDYVQGLRVALDIAERQASESHNDIWNRAVAEIALRIEEEIEEAETE